MNTSIFPTLIIALLLAPLSGCLAVPDGAIGHGDNVQAIATVTDADTGEVLLSSQRINFAVGQGTSGLGYEFERRLIGEADDFEGTITIRGDPSMQWGRTVDAQALYESPLVQSIPQQQFVQTFGEPVAGENFAPPNSFFDYLVVSADGNVVQYRPLPADDQRDPVPNVGAILVTRVDGDTLVQILEPDMGATFRILPPSQFNPGTPLGLEPGSYRTVGGDGQTITYQHSSSTNPGLVGRDLIIQVTVQSVRQAQAPGPVEPVDGNYGVRTSPYVNGVPSDHVDFGPLSGQETAPAAEDDHDGHDH